MSDDLLPVLTLPSGLTVNANVRCSTDWIGMKSLVESGVPILEVAKHFKVAPSLVKRKAQQEDWLTPSKVESLRREITAKQARIFKESGKSLDVNAVKAQIWKERTEQRNEKIHAIVMNALDGVDEEKAKKMIKSPLSLLHITQASRLITGEEQLEAAAPQTAVNISFLRSQRPVDVPVIDVEVS